jgi:hypothetical protein
MQKNSMQNDIHTYNNLTQGHSCGPKKLQAGQGPADHYAAVTANGAGLLPGAGGGSSSMAVVAASGWRRGAGDGGSSRCRRGRRQLRMIGQHGRLG